MKKLVLLGAGGHCESVLDAILQGQEFDDIVILDRSEKVGQDVMGVSVIGTDEELANLYKRGFRYAFITAGSIKSTDLRRHLYSMAVQAGFDFTNVIDRTAILARNVQMGKGIFIGKKAVINSGTVIEDQAIINTGAIIEHDCFIGMFSHISVGTVLCGGVKVGQDSFIGANATVIQGKELPDKTIIGAGEVIKRAYKINADNVPGLKGKRVEGQL